MERKNTVLLTVIAIATLLVAVVGATFAYFTATSTSSGDDVGTATAKTAKVGGAKLEASSITQVGKMDYPGGVLITGTKVELSKQDEGDQNDYEVTFDIGLTGVNETTEEMNWYLFRTASDASSQEITNHVNCSLQTPTTGTETKYYYTGCEATGAEGIISSEFSDYELVAYGKLNGSTSKPGSPVSPTEENSNFNGAFEMEKEPVGLSGQKLTTNGNKVYTYYLIVEFPNKESASQNGEGNANFDKQISVSFDSIDSITTKVVS